MTHKEYESKSQMKRVEILKAEEKQMTHDELLARIDDDEKFLEQYFGAKFKGQSALRAVVELHKPTGWFEDTGYADQECVHCDNGSYPCPTIQAIEKELG